MTADSETANGSLKLYEKDGADVYGAEFRYLGGARRLDLLGSGTIGSDIYRMSFLETGDIGIGTADPAATLEINADSGVDDPHLLLNETDGKDGLAKLFFKNNDTSNAFVIEGSLGDLASSLYFNYPAVNNPMSISGDGGVGWAQWIRETTNSVSMIRKRQAAASYVLKIPTPVPVPTFWN